MPVLTEAPTIRTEAPASTSPDLDLLPRRDLLGRRVGTDIQRRLLRVLMLLVSDVALVAASLWAASRVAGGVSGAAWFQSLPWVGAVVVLGQVASSGYGPIRQERPTERVLLGLAYSSLAVAGAVLSGLGGFGTAQAILVPPLLLVTMTGTRMLMARFVTGLYNRGLGVKNTIVLGSAADARRMAGLFRASTRKELRIVGFLSDHAPAEPDALGTISDLSRVLEEHDVRGVIISSQLAPPTMQALVAECFRRGAAVSVVPATLTEIPVKVSGGDVLSWPLLELRVPRLHLLQLAVKRASDLIGSIAGLLVLSPVIAVVALAVRLEGRPVLFRQTRLGVGGRRFTIYKFRSMRPDAETVLRSNGALHEKYVANNYKLPEGEDPRVSRLGAFLRRTSLDELPQLFNVVRGDMSLVGPRPIVPKEIREYGEDAPTFLGVKPGITGWWQINGRSRIGYPERARLDMEYIQTWSLWLDTKIVLLTLPRIFRGAH